MTRLEQETYEVVEHCLPRIANALESIAKSLAEIHKDFCRTQTREYIESQDKIPELNIEGVNDGKAGC